MAGLTLESKTKEQLIEDILRLRDRNQEQTSQLCKADSDIAWLKGLLEKAMAALAKQ